MGVRKNIRSLTPMETQRFVSALIQLKASGAYDTYVTTHMNAMHHAHSGPAFLPWHREFLRRLERDLQGVDSSVTLPYWDWTTDNTTTSLPWHVDLMGGNGRASDQQVMDGPFAYSGGHWPINVDTPPNFLKRQLGVLAASLPGASDVATVMGVTPYDSAPWDTSPINSFRNQLEGWQGPNVHNRVHVWVGGSMYPMSSPNDPVFFLHHCNIDRLWAQWQASHPAEGYQPIMGGPLGHNLTDAMEPWGALTTVASVLDHHALGYTYDTEVVKHKFTDEPVKKAVDDPGPRVKKIVDDPIKHKFTDEPVKKVVDDPGPIAKKTVDDPKSKFTDEPVKKVVDDPKPPPADIPKLPGDVKTPGLDVPFDPGIGNVLSGAPGGLPFALATPHHSMAWAHASPGAGSETLSQVEALGALTRRLTQQTAELEALAAQQRALLTVSQAEPESH